MIRWWPITSAIFIFVSTHLPMPAFVIMIRLPNMAGLFLCTALKWKLTTVVERTINGLKENVKSEKTLMLNFNFKPGDLSHDEYAKDKLNSPQLHKYIQDQELRGTEGLSTLQVEEYRRLATPCSVLILTLIGAVIASRKVRGGSGAHLAIGFVAGALFILMDRFSTIFSTKGNFPPLLAAW